MSEEEGLSDTREARMAQELAEASARRLREGDHATRAAGIVLLEVGPGRASMSMEVAKDMTNGHGMCHGGYLFLLADTAFNARRGRGRLGRGYGRALTAGAHRRRPDRPRGTPTRAGRLRANRTTGYDRRFDRQGAPLDRPASR